LVLVAKGAEAAIESLPELRRLVQGLIGITLTSLEKLNS
jgi:hypothetical protein